MSPSSISCYIRNGPCTHLNPDKCIVKQPRIKFFDNYLTPEGIEPDPQKVITEMKAPENATELQSLLGMANYLSRFAPNIAGITGPLRDLVKHDADWQWCPDTLNKHLLLMS